MVRVFLFALISSVFLAGFTGAAQDKMPQEIGVSERLGQRVPLDLLFYDENGSPVRLGDLIDKPTILNIVYYHCHHICPEFLFGLADVVSQLPMTPGKDYGILTVSLDPRDTPKDARDQKINYMKAIKKPFPAKAWKFLTGGAEDIAKITDAVGISFTKKGHGFIHPEVLIFLSPQGMISRYLYVSKYSYGLAYPITFLPVEISQAIRDASNGVVSDTGRRTALLCFPHEPPQQERFFSILGVSGGITLVMLAAFFVYLQFANRKKSGQKDDR